MNPYRRQVLQLLTRFLVDLPRPVRALDYGSGDGWFSQQLLDRGLVDEITAVDVLRRDNCIVEPVIYDGTRLPFDDGAFDLVIAVDVIHHTPDPQAALLDLLRCSRNRVVLKDHNHEGLPGRALLSLLDELGNRRFGVPSLYRYQKQWAWLPWFEEAGFRQRELLRAAPCEPRIPLTWFVNRLHFIGAWERESASGLPGTSIPSN